MSMEIFPRDPCGIGILERYEIVGITSAFNEAGNKKEIDPHDFDEDEKNFFKLIDQIPIDGQDSDEKFSKTLSNYVKNNIKDFI